MSNLPLRRPDAYAQVAVENAVYHFDRLFTYRVPERLCDRVMPGVRVTVPFGAGDRERVGMVFSLGDGQMDGAKDILSVPDREPLLTPKMLELARWIKERYYCTFFEAVKLMIPAGLYFRLRDSYVLSPSFKNFDRESYPSVQWQIIMLLREAGKSVPVETISKRLGISNDSPDLATLLEKGIICKVSVVANRMKDASVKMVRPLPDFSGKLTPRQRDVYSVLLDAGEATEKELCYFTGASAGVVKALSDKGAAEIFEYEVYRRPEFLEEDKERGKINLSPDQQEIFNGLWADWNDPSRPRTALLYGVTGSGKTSVFLKLIDRVRQAGRGVIVMVPEISLTGQAIRRFRRSFGDGVAVFHSGLSLGERMDEWKRVARGEAGIVVGTRSAVFAPVKNLGLIVIDEEQEHTYKSESSPRYDAREVARFRCRQTGAFCLFSSATPSVETCRLASEGKFGFYRLENRFGNAQMPEVRLVDMNFDSPADESHAIGNTLARSLRENFENGHQSIVLLNRRGYHTFAICSSCHEVVNCPNCSISLTYHADNHRLLCHYCGYSVPYSAVCPSCGAEAVTFRGLGTQRAEEQLRELLPKARILRVDTDSVAGRCALEEKFSQFAHGEYDVMVGTQMVAKGLDFENVTLVGVLSADQSLYSDDFRSGERTFDLLTQVVGRAGRGKYSGTALIQTWVPESSILQLAAHQDYFGFYQQEIVFRKAMLYPPFVDLMVFGFVGTRETQVQNAARRFLEMLMSLARQEYPDLPLRVLRPTQAAVVRVGGKYRYKLIVKCRNTTRFREMSSRLLLGFASIQEFRQVTAYADPDPRRIL